MRISNVPSRTLILFLLLAPVAMPGWAASGAVPEAAGSPEKLVAALYEAVSVAPGATHEDMR